MNYVWIGLGGILGAIARHTVAEVVANRIAGDFPLGIFIVNISGAFVLGLMAGLSERAEWISPAVRLGAMVGFLGAFTTFSTWSVDTLRLLESGRYGAALFNLLGSAGAGLFAAWVGMTLGRLAR